MERRVGGTMGNKKDRTGRGETDAEVKERTRNELKPLLWRPLWGLSPRRDSYSRVI